MSEETPKESKGKADAFLKETAASAGSVVKKKKLFPLMLAIIAIIVLASSAGSLIENVPTDKIGVLQSLGSGEISCWTTPGLKAQLGGNVVYYDKSSEFWFSAQRDQGNRSDQSIKITFNDAGTARISGSVAFEMPFEDSFIKDIRTRYKSTEELRNRLVRTTIEKAIFASGSLMSSTESYGEKRNALISFIEDQAKNGIYATTTKDIQIKDIVTGEKKTLTVTERISDKTAPGGWKRQEKSPIGKFGIKLYNFSVNDIKYDPKVLSQIDRMRTSTMEVQTSMADRKKAEQESLTVDAQGRAKVAKEKWAQEEIRVQQSAKAQRDSEVAEIRGLAQLKVAELDRKAAEQEKAATILRAEGAAKAAQMRMKADGALTQKLEALKYVHKAYAEAIGKHKGAQTVFVSGNSKNAGALAGSLPGLQELVQSNLAIVSSQLGAKLNVSK